MILQLQNLLSTQFYFLIHAADLLLPLDLVLNRQLLPKINCRESIQIFVFVQITSVAFFGIYGSNNNIYNKRYYSSIETKRALHFCRNKCIVMLKFVFAMKRAQIVKVIAPFSTVITELFLHHRCLGLFQESTLL